MVAPSEERKEELVGVFLEVTHSSDQSQANQMLEWYGWEVDRAVSAFMLGDITPPRSFLAPRATPASAVADRETAGLSAAMDTSSGFGLAGGAGLAGAGLAGAGLAGAGLAGAGLAGADEDVYGGDSGGPRGDPPGVLSVVIGLPFRLLGKAISYALSPINYVLGVEEQPKDGGAAARRFVSQFKTEYVQEKQPNFVAESYREAVQEAARQHKFLVVYLHAPLHQDTPSFCRTTLCSEPMVEFMEHNVLVWGGSLLHSEAFAVSNTLGVCAYPYVGLLLCKENEVQVVERVEGTENTERLLDRLTTAMARFQEQLDRVFRQQREREEARRLRQEQDNEYSRGLEADRQRQEEQEQKRLAKEREADEARARAEETAAEVAKEEQGRLEQLDGLRSRVGREPAPGKNGTRIRLQLPNGSKVDRRFAEDRTVGEIRAFVTLHLADNDIPIKNFSMSTNFPRKTYEEDEDNLSVVEAGLHPTAMLFVHDLDA